MKIKKDILQKIRVNFDQRFLDGHGGHFEHQLAPRVLATGKVDNTYDFGRFLRYAFNWERSPEGHNYWRDLEYNPGKILINKSCTL